MQFMNVYLFAIFMRAHSQSTIQAHNKCLFSDALTQSACTAEAFISLKVVGLDACCENVPLQFPNCNCHLDYGQHPRRRTKPWQYFCKEARRWWPLEWNPPFPSDSPGTALRGTLLDFLVGFIQGWLTPHLRLDGGFIIIVSVIVHLAESFQRLGRGWPVMQRWPWRESFVRWL